MKSIRENYKLSDKYYCFHENGTCKWFVSCLLCNGDPDCAACYDKNGKYVFYCEENDFCAKCKGVKGRNSCVYCYGDGVVPGCCGRKGGFIKGYQDRRHGRVYKQCCRVCNRSQEEYPKPQPPAAKQTTSKLAGVVNAYRSVKTLCGNFTKLFGRTPKKSYVIPEGNVRCPLCMGEGKCVTCNSRGFLPKAIEILIKRYKHLLETSNAIEIKPNQAGDIWLPATLLGFHTNAKEVWIKCDDVEIAKSGCWIGRQVVRIKGDSSGKTLAD